MKELLFTLIQLTKYMRTAYFTLCLNVILLLLLLLYYCKVLLILLLVVVVVVVLLVAVYSSGLINDNRHNLKFLFDTINKVLYPPHSAITPISSNDCEKIHWQDQQYQITAQVCTPLTTQVAHPFLLSEFKPFLQ